MIQAIYKLFTHLQSALNPNQKPDQVGTYQVNVISEVDKTYLLISRVLSFSSIIPSFIAFAEVHIIDGVMITKLLPGADQRELEFLSKALSKWNPE